MRRLAAGALLLAVVFSGSGCVVVVATVASAAAITATTVKTTAKVTTATVSTTGKVTAAAITSSGDVTALSMESAARLARTGMVVLVDAGSGAIVELPWRDGMRAYAASQSQGWKNGFKAAKIFRNGRVLSANLRRIRAGSADVPLRPGDVVELLR